MLPMLCIPEKKTTSVDLDHRLVWDIAHKYPECKDQDLEEDVQTVDNLRSQLAKPPKNSSFTARLVLLQSYFHALCVIETLFSSLKDQINNLPFTWYDAFKPKEKASQLNIHLEKAAVFFNLGAVYSQIGESKDRSTQEERRQAAENFRLATGAFAYLKDNLAAEAAMGEATTVDVSKECAGMLEKVMRAQAQECWFEIVVANKSTPEACALVSRQVAFYYKEALAALNAAPLKKHVGRDWKSYVQLKAALFNAEACDRCRLKPHEEGGIADEIAMLNSGISTLSEAKESTRGGLLQRLGISTKIKKILAAIDELEAKMERSLTEAKKDIGYPRGYPSPASLPPLERRSMVKQPIPANEVLGASNEKLFASLFHRISAQALSRFDERVAGIIQTHEEKLQQCSELIHTRLNELTVYKLALEEHHTLPARLKEDVEAVQISGGPAGLLQQLQDLRQVNQELVVQTEEHLQTRPQSSTLTKNLQDQLNRIITNLKQEDENYARIESSAMYHSALMSILDRRPVESAFPNISLDPNEDAIVKAVKESLRELENLGAQGERLQQDLKHMNRKSITEFRGTRPSLLEDLFRKEISKYERTCKEIVQNIEAREQLLKQIQAQNDQLSSFSNLGKYKGSRQKFNEEFQAAIAKYREIKQNIDQAKNLYDTLQKTLKNEKRQCGEFVMTRNIQCPEMTGLEPEVYGQAAPDLIAGNDSEGAIEKILEMGAGTWDRDTVVCALDAASNNLERAVEYLYSGILEQDEVPPAARVPPGAQAANLPARPALSAQPAPGQLASAMPQDVIFTPEECEKMERLEEMGFNQASVREAYLACDKNEELAVRYLLKDT